jgi:2-keto-4-pentenoate hydratase/2-oxohepta-3-ene-1,7-dioic acid hydratase in catechol pathway
MLTSFRAHVGDIDMKLVRYGAPGTERAGMLAAAGSIRDLAEHVSDITGSTFAPEMLQTLAALDPKALPLVAGSPRLGVCLRGVGKFICIGLNYSDHAAESGMEVPKEPVGLHEGHICNNGAK